MFVVDLVRCVYFVSGLGLINAHCFRQPLATFHELKSWKLILFPVRADNVSVAYKKTVEA